VALVEAYTDLTPWVWVAILAAAGLGVFGVYLTDRSQWDLLIPAYVMWAVAGLTVPDAPAPSGPEADKPPAE
jgi:hypothetical protein